MYPIKTYEKADSVEHAITLLQQNPEFRIIAGGTDVLIRLHKGKQAFEHLIDIHELEELKPIRLRDDGTLIIGSGVTFTQIIESEIIKKHIPVLAQAVRTVGGPQVRNVATIGGNICNGVTSADSATTLFTLNTILNIQGADGSRKIPISEFYLGPGKVDLKNHEVLVSFEISPENYLEYSGSFFKYAMRDAMDIATIGCSSLCRIRDNRLVDFRLAYGVAGPVPMRCPITEKKAKGKEIEPGLLEEIAHNVERDVNPRTSWRASKEFRLQIIRELACRVVKNAVESAGGVF